MSQTISSMSFGPLTIDYDTTVLEPRRWTRCQSEWASRLLGDLPAGPVLELCTGAGHIGLLAVHAHRRRLVAVDASPEACAWARRNAAQNGIDADVREGDLMDVLAPHERFPLIVADPPWVPRGEIDRFPEDPTSAIDGGEDGLELARLCLRLIGAHLAPGGVALLQLGTSEQIDALETDLHSAGLRAGERLIAGNRGVVICLRRR